MSYVYKASYVLFHFVGIDLYNTGSRIQWHQVKPAEMTNLEYGIGGISKCNKMADLSRKRVNNFHYTLKHGRVVWW